jgi:glycosyltransferase involved in cell wall biosynthesis
MLVLPSTQESLSIVLLEAWSVGTPVLVNGDCDVLVGQCRRAQGGLWYHGREQFVEAVQYLVSNPDVRERMGRNGRQYVDANYRWDTIERKFLEFTASTLSQPAASG